MKRSIPLLLLGLACQAASACGSAPAPTAPGAPAPQFPTPQPPSPIFSPHIRYTAFLAFGDSNTEGESTPLRHDPATPGVERGYPFKLQAMLAARYRAQEIAVYNGGLSGERPSSPAVVQRFVALVTQLRPEVVVLMHGVNDLNAQISIADAVAAMELLVGEARRRNLPTIVLTLPPQRPGAPLALAAARVQPFNQALTRMAADEGALVLDLHAIFPVELLAPDGLHITQAGNQLIAEAVFEKLRVLYELVLPERR